LDILDEAGLDIAFKQAKPEVVVHLAAEKRGDPVAIYKTNVDGMLNVVCACKRFGVKKILFSSSSAVYGHDHQVEHAECRPTSAYGRSKLIGEHLLHACGVPSLAMRFFNVYGEGGESVVNVIDNCMQTGDMFTVFNRGVMKRDFIPVEMIVDAIVAGMEHDFPTSLLGTLNVGSGHGFSVRDLVALAETCGDLNYVVEETSKRVDTNHSIADIERGAGFFDLTRSREQLEVKLLRFWGRDR
jgi:nucleoside-diphosphate-sugar epimerase